MNESEIKILLEIKANINVLIKAKNDQIDMLTQEIERMTQDITKINNLISEGSFTTAASLIDAETAAKKDFSSEHLHMGKKIFGDSGKLLAVLQYTNQSIQIRFSFPEIVSISQEEYITDIVKPILLPLKEREPNMQPEITKQQRGNDSILNTLVLNNITQYESFNYIYKELSKYLTKFTE